MNANKNYLTEFSVYQQEYNRLRCGLYPEALNLANLARNTHAPLWNKSNFIETIKAIVESHKKFILEHDLVKLIGKSKVDSLLKYKFLYKRPTNNFVNDIINPPNKPIFDTDESAIDVCNEEFTKTQILINILMYSNVFSHIK